MTGQPGGLADRDIAFLAHTLIKALPAAMLYLEGKKMTFFLFFLLFLRIQAFFILFEKIHSLITFNRRWRHTWQHR
jgi:hypothetical protein